MSSYPCENWSFVWWRWFGKQLSGIFNIQIQLFSWFKIKFYSIWTKKYKPKVLKIFSLILSRMWCLNCITFLTARLRWRGLRNGLFVVVALVVLVVLGKLFPIPRKKWTFTALLAEQRVHEISGLLSLSTKLVDFRACPRN